MRIRTVKPEFWTHPIMGRLDGESQALALGLLNLADDEGYFLADPAGVRSALRPFDDDSTKTRRGLDACSAAGWIEVRQHPTHGAIGWVVNFLKHQRIDRPRESNLVQYWQVASFVESSTIDRRTLDDASSPERKGKEGNGRGKEGKSAAATPAPRETDRLMADFAEIIGSPYAFKPKDGVAFAELRKHSELDEISRRWRSTLKSTDKWLGVRTIAALNMRWNELAKLPVDLTGDWRSRVDHTKDFFDGVDT